LAVKKLKIKKIKKNEMYTGKRKYGSYKQGQQSTLVNVAKAIKVYKRRKYKKSVPKILKSLEVKNFDTTLATTAIVNGGVIINSSLNLIRLGTDDTNRIGRKVNVASIHLRGVITLPASSTATLTLLSTTVRLILYVDKQCNGVAATVTEILATADEKAFRNLDQTDRFDILMDKYQVMEPQTLTSLAGPLHYTPGRKVKLTYNKTKCNIPLKFDADAGAITDLTSNNIGIMAISDSDAGCFLDVQARLRFTDI